VCSRAMIVTEEADVHTRLSGAGGGGGRLERCRRQQRGPAE
jgi:hypothetical protein